MLKLLQLNSLYDKISIWWHRSGWKLLARAMACCLTTPSHYLNQCWVAFTWGQFHKKYSQTYSKCSEITLSKLLPFLQGANGAHSLHDDVIKWKHVPRYWHCVREIRWSPVNSPHKGQWCRALMFSLICAWINGWVNNREAGDFAVIMVSL